MKNPRLIIRSQKKQMPDGAENYVRPYNRIYVKCKVNGEKIKALVDTGSSVTMTTMKLARALGLETE